MGAVGGKGGGETGGKRCAGDGRESRESMFGRRDLSKVQCGLKGGTLPSVRDTAEMPSTHGND